ncbi:MAG: hypothetical protein LBC19_09480, partial [Tannerella sp.]|nr:hypothetical protein [Tannerella sp.]
MTTLRLLMALPLSLRFPSLDGTGKLPLFSCRRHFPVSASSTFKARVEARSFYTPPFPQAARCAFPDEVHRFSGGLIRSFRKVS